MCSLGQTDVFCNVEIAIQATSQTMMGYNKTEQNTMFLVIVFYQTCININFDVKKLNSIFNSKRALLKQSLLVTFFSGKSMLLPSTYKIVISH